MDGTDERDDRDVRDDRGWPGPHGPRGVTRRAFLAGGVAALAGGAATGCLPGVDGTYDDTVCAYTEPSVSMAYPAHAGRVVVDRDAALANPTTGAVSAIAVRASLQKVLQKLSGKSEAREIWDVILPGHKPGDVIGIKVNVLNSRVPTSPILVQELVGLLKAAGIASDAIVVWDRRLDELTRAGFSAAALGCKLEGTWETTSGKGVGRGYEFDTVCLAGLKTHLSTIQTRAVDHLINVAVMKNHFVTGYTGVLKNHYGTIDNPGDFHGSIHKRAVPAVNALSEVAARQRLCLLDALVGVCFGDTDAPPDCVPSRIAASLDPVALDAHGRAIRDEMASTSPNGTPETKSDAWLAQAEKLGLGRATVKLEDVSST